MSHGFSLIFGGKLDRSWHQTSTKNNPKGHQTNGKQKAIWRRLGGVLDLGAVLADLGEGNPRKADRGELHDPTPPIGIFSKSKPQTTNQCPLYTVLGPGHMTESRPHTPSRKSAVADIYT